MVALRFFEHNGAVHKALSVIKKRTGKHENTIRELKISSSGITVGPPLKHLRGVLGGSPVSAGSGVLGEEQPRADDHE